MTEAERARWYFRRHKTTEHILSCSVGCPALTPFFQEGAEILYRISARGHFPQKFLTEKILDQNLFVDQRTTLLLSRFWIYKEKTILAT